MKIKICILLLALLLSVQFIGCEKVLLASNFSSDSFFEGEGSDSELTDEQMKAIISKIPSEQYEAYSILQNIPLSATLYKDGVVIDIDIRDPRLIRLVNFFNNALYYGKCYYRQSFYSQEELKDVIHREFRLELKYEPRGEKRPGPYENQPTLFDTIIVTDCPDDFVLINHDYPIRDVDGEIIHPCTAAGYEPFFGWMDSWLELFGF